jgi:hypothetical protein
MPRLVFNRKDTGRELMVRNAGVGTRLSVPA